MGSSESRPKIQTSKASSGDPTFQTPIDPHTDLNFQTVRACQLKPMMGADSKAHPGSEIFSARAFNRGVVWQFL